MRGCWIFVLKRKKMYGDLYTPKNNATTPSPIIFFRNMKISVHICSILLLAQSCTEQIKNGPISVNQKKTEKVKDSFKLECISPFEKSKPVINKKIFHLCYTSVGMGSNFTSMQPVFNANGNKFIYTSEQTSYYNGMEKKTPETILTGKFRKSSIDSILDLIHEIKDSLVFRNNTHISSGGIQYIVITKDKINLEFELWNETDPIAEKIVAILNNYIPDEKGKLFLWTSMFEEGKSK